MNSPIGNNLQAHFEDVRQTAYKRGHLQARLDLLDQIRSINTNQRTAVQALTEVLAIIDNLDKPKPKKPETRGRKPKTK